MTSLLLFGSLLRLPQFDSGGGQGKPKLPVRTPKPPRLEVSIARAEWTAKNELAVSILLRNAGDGELKIDPAMLDARWELVVIQLSDKAGRRVRFKDDDIAAVVLLNPERYLSLWPGRVYGLETVLSVPKPADETFVRGYVGYPDQKPKTVVWTGEVWSEKVRVKPLIEKIKGYRL